MSISQEQFAPSSLIRCSCLLGRHLRCQDETPRFRRGLHAIVANCSGDLALSFFQRNVLPCLPANAGKHSSRPPESHGIMWFLIPARAAESPAAAIPYRSQCHPALKVRPDTTPALSEARYSSSRGGCSRYDTLRICLQRAVHHSDHVGEQLLFDSVECSFRKIPCSMILATVRSWPSHHAILAHAPAFFILCRNQTAREATQLMVNVSNW